MKWIFQSMKITAGYVIGITPEIEQEVMQKHECRGAEAHEIEVTGQTFIHRNSQLNGHPASFFLRKMFSKFANPC
jgi:hypothetical protein